MALTKITRGVIKANENYDTHNINSTGIVTAVSANFTGDVSIGGTLTYQDVTNIDSVGIITARAGVNVSGGQLDVGSNIKLGNAGVITATSYRGDGSQLTGISADSTKIETGNTKVETIDTGSDGHVKITTEGTERFRIASDGKLSITGSTANMEYLRMGGNNDRGLRFSSSTGSSSVGVVHTINAPGDSGAQGEIVLQTNSTERLRIDSAGRVMLGTTSVGPTAGEQLTIADSVNAGITIRSGTTAAGTILFEDDTADRGEIQYSHNGDYMRFKTGGSERVRIDSDGHLQIRREGVAGVTGTDSRHTRYIVKQSNGQEAILGSVFAQGKSGWGGDLVFASKNANSDPSTGLTERLRINSAGLMLMGRTVSLNDNIAGTGYANKVQIEGNGTGQGLAVSNAGGIARINIVRKYTASNGDDLGYISFSADPGTSIERARIVCQAEFTNANTRGGNLKFYTCSNGGYIPTERLRITSNGDIGIGNVTPGNSFPNGKAIAIGDNDTGIRQNGDGILELWANNQQCFRVRTTGNLSYHTLAPGSDNSVDLGSTSLRWRNIYTADLQMSNEGSANDVDGTWGKYTIQEGENDLFLINRRNGKKYKFNLTEVG